MTSAEHELPRLMSTQVDHSRGLNFNSSLHMTIKTGVLSETLAALGTKVRSRSCNICNTHDHAAAGIAKASMVCMEGETAPEDESAQSR